MDSSTSAPTYDERRVLRSRPQRVHFDSRDDQVSDVSVPAEAQCTMPHAASNAAAARSDDECTSVPQPIVTFVTAPRVTSTSHDASLAGSISVSSTKKQ